MYVNRILPVFVSSEGPVLLVGTNVHLVAPGLAVLRVQVPVDASNLIRIPELALQGHTNRGHGQIAISAPASRHHHHHHHHQPKTNLVILIAHAFLGLGSVDHTV